MTPTRLPELALADAQNAVDAVAQTLRQAKSCGDRWRAARSCAMRALRNQLGVSRFAGTRSYSPAQ